MVGKAYGFDSTTSTTICDANSTLPDADPSRTSMWCTDFPPANDDDDANTCCANRSLWLRNDGLVVGVFPRRIGNDARTRVRVLLPTTV